GFRRRQNFDGAPQPGFGNSQRVFDHFDFLLGFCFALRPEKSVGRTEPDSTYSYLLRVAERKICRNDSRSDAAFPEKMGQDFLVRRCIPIFALRLALQFIERNKFVRLGLLATAIDLQIAQDQGAPAILLKKNEWIGRKKSRRIQHVRVAFTGGDDQARGFISAHSWSNNLRPNVQRLTSN